MKTIRVSAALIAASLSFLCGCREKTPAEKLEERVKEMEQRLKSEQAKKQKDFEVALSKAEAGDSNAQMDLYLAFAKGEVVEKDEKKALAWCRKSAAQNNRLAQFTLGHHYYNGESVLQDFVESASWFKKSADQGLPAAQQKLGSMYLSGKGVERDDVQALKLLRKAAVIGHDAEAAEQISDIYAYHEQRASYIKLSRSEDEQAFAWITEIAMKGDTVAQCQVALMYRYGIGCSKDMVKAHAWCNVANSLGSEKAGKLMNYIGFTFLKKDELKEAQAAAAELLKSMPQEAR
jgi:TPR repeat protein